MKDYYLVMVLLWDVCFWNKNKEEQYIIDTVLVFVEFMPHGPSCKTFINIRKFPFLQSTIDELFNCE